MARKNGIGFEAIGLKNKTGRAGAVYLPLGGRKAKADFRKLLVWTNVADVAERDAEIREIVLALSNRWMSGVIAKSVDRCSDLVIRVTRVAEYLEIGDVYR